VTTIAALLIAAITGTSPSMNDLPANDTSQIKATLVQVIRGEIKQGRHLELVEQAARLSASLPPKERMGLGCASAKRMDGQPAGAHDSHAYAEAKLRAISTIVNRRPGVAIELTVGGMERLQIQGAGQGADVKDRVDGRMERTVLEHSLTPIGAIDVVERLAISVADQRFACVMVKEG
jgi:hypothetical protein